MFSSRNIEAAKTEIEKFAHENCNLPADKPMPFGVVDDIVLRFVCEHERAQLVAVDNRVFLELGSVAMTNAKNTLHIRYKLDKNADLERFGLYLGDSVLLRVEEPALDGHEVLKKAIDRLYEAAWAIHEACEG